MTEAQASGGKVTNFPVGKLRKVIVDREDVLVANVGGTLYAIGGKCTHRGGPLAEGELEGNIVTCPWHGGKFDVTTGKVISPPPVKDEVAYDVRIKGADVLLKKK